MILKNFNLNFYIYNRYKFSWSPVGALLSLKNDAIFLENGSVRKVESKDLLYTAEKKNINMGLSLEGYANRDSVK